jgi:hypothetical protein
MKIKRLIVLVLAIAVTSGTARSKDQYVMVRIQCSYPNFEVHFPKHIGADPKFGFVYYGDRIGEVANHVKISASGQVIRCDATRTNSSGPTLMATYQYTVKRKVLGYTPVAGNPAALDCKVEP